MLRAVQFGAGNIGRGFIGQLLYEAGYATTFVDANEDLVGNLARAQCYPLRLVSSSGMRQYTIANFTAVSVRHQERVTAEIVTADLIAVAVGVHALPFVAVSLAQGLNERARMHCAPIDVLLCENQLHVASMMRDLIGPRIGHDVLGYFEDSVGLVEAVIGRMVPTPTAEVLAENPLMVVAEPYKELPIDMHALRGTAPKLPGSIEAANYPAFEARKLFVHNMTHAALAYLGYEKGYTFIWQCALDPELTASCARCTEEIVAALVAEYQFDAEALGLFAADLMERFTNKALGDTVARVAADPMRKLRADDRLVGAALLCRRHAIPYDAISRVIASALRYDNIADPAAIELQALRRKRGDAGALRELCGDAADVITL